MAALWIPLVLSWLLVGGGSVSVAVAGEDAAEGEGGRPPSIIPGTEVESAGVVGDLEDWVDEAIAIAAGKVMGKLVDWLLSDAEGAFPPGATAVAMFPEDGLVEVFDDGGIQIQRMESGKVADGRMRPIKDAAAALRNRFRSLADRHGKTKVVGVRSVPGEGGRVKPRMDVEVELSGVDGRTGDRLQVNARWETEWSAAASPEDPELRRLWVRAFEIARAKTGAGATVFRDATQRVLGGTAAYRDDLRFGVDHWIERIEERFGITVGGWNGLAVGDADGDGLDDLYVCGTGGLPNRLFIRDDDGNLEDRASDAGVDWLESTQGALFVDLDNDGDQDLVVSTLTGLLVHSNDGHGRFAVRAALPFPGAMPYSIASADYDLDGDLDLFVTGYNHRRGIEVEQRALFERPVPYHDATNGGRNVLLRNEGGWRFRHVTKAVGLDDGDRRFSYAASWEDYDQDGDPDLYIADDFGRNTLYRNDSKPGGEQPARFTEVAEAAGVMDHAAGMSVDWGDYDNDGWMDLYVGNMFSSAGSRISRLGKFMTDVEVATKALFQRHARGNSLFRNLGGNGKFDDVSVEQCVTLGRWAWGSKFVDFNNDGWRDLVVANGFITQEEDTGDL